MGNCVAITANQFFRPSANTARLCIPQPNACNLRSCMQRWLCFLSTSNLQKKTLLTPCPFQMMLLLMCWINRQTFVNSYSQPSVSTSSLPKNVKSMAMTGDTTATKKSVLAPPFISKISTVFIAWEQRWDYAGLDRTQL